MPPGPLPYREIRCKREIIGFVEVGQQGSHVKFARTDVAGTRIVVDPRHREVAAGTIRSILHQAKVTWEEFEDP